MRVERLGDGEPELAVVAAIHGDEPCGMRAIERLIAEGPAVERPVKLIVANERALDEGVRYTEADLNRIFPGAPDAPEYERRLATDLLREVRDCTVLSLHSTQSFDRPFAVIEADDPIAAAVSPYLSIEAAVDVGGFAEGRLIDYADVIEIECGYQGSAAAAENAYELIREFLTAVGALSGGEPDTRQVPIYRLERRIPKDPADDYGVLVENFERVAAGTVFATAGERELVADEPFYPVLLSSHGYQEEFGYAAERIGAFDRTPVETERGSHASGR
ncbi:succinylglutamate desuccinylase [Halobacteriales archaeon QH_8_64_26]|jgi:succinylglutamate desuccinylase|nr:MAG: succinylglutamate desuccinylase [Halobacteriales archaeon QH_8_64_26]